MPKPPAGSGAKRIPFRGACMEQPIHPRTWAWACLRVLALLRDKFGERMFQTVIGLDTKFREASAAGKVVQELAPDCRGAGEYARLAEEVAAL